MLDRVKNPVLDLVLLLLLVLPVLPVSSVRSMMLDRTRHPILALELSKRYKSKAYIVSARIIYAFSCLYLCWSVLVFVWLVFVFVGIAFFSLGVQRVPYDLYLVWGGSLFIVWGGTWLFFAAFLGLLVFFVVPVLAVASVVGERQRGTSMLVQLSLLQPFDIVWGKVVASIDLVLFPAGAWVFTTLFALMPLSLMPLSEMLLSQDMRSTINLTITEIGIVVISVSSMVVGGLAVLIIVFAVPAASVLISTFAKSSAAAGATAIAVNCCIGILFVVLTVPTIANFPLSSLLLTLFILSFTLGVVWVSVWWACRRLRLPAGK